MAVNAVIPHNKARRQKEKRSTAERMLAAQPPREELGLREEQLSREVSLDQPAFTFFDLSADTGAHRKGLLRRDAAADQP